MTTGAGARPGRGIALVLAMSVCFAISDTLIKYLGATLPVLLLLWARYAIQAGAMALWLLRRGGPGFSTAHPRFQWMRGALLLATSGMSFFGLQRMPVAEFTALGMLTPVVVTMLAAWVLHEPVSPMRWALVWGGFAGALIVIRPGAGVFGWAAVFPLLMALCYGAFQVLTSRMATLESPFTTQFYTGLSGALLVTPLVAWHAGDHLAALQAAPMLHWLLLLAIGVFATAGHLCLVVAFGVAPMATLMPFVYVQIGSALAVSWVVFRHVPDGWAWVGMAVIAACGAASAWLNARRAGARRDGASVIAADTIYD
ncbi:MAG TPA: DMT family transporter [Burkholderiaceae bacterium]|nr:DMT family transporter [Burkholderiaceae bacterium]